MRFFAIACALTACDGAAPAIDGGTDAGPAIDAGFDPASLDPCEIDLGLAFDASPYASYDFLEDDPLAVRAFYPFVVLAVDGTTGGLEPIATARRDGLRTAALCAGADACVSAALGWNDADALSAADAVVTALDAGGLAIVATRLRSSGVCARFDADDASLVRACVHDALLQATAAIEGTVLGELDDATLDAVVDAIAPDAQPFWGPVVEVAIDGLYAAARNEAVRYEPLDETQNGAAVARVPSIAFDDFSYAAIVVPGQGPEDPDTALSQPGRDRCDLAYARWQAGLAPLILLSGGHVHPDRTVFSEAIEMKRYLIGRGVPEDAILVDPYARHTTTNLRNAVRILVRAGVPVDRPLLVTSDLFQSAYIASSDYAARCDDELGYRPFADIEALSRTDACWLPALPSLHVDARDPLDP